MTTSHSPFPDETPVWVRYPMDDATDRQEWPCLPGTVLERCGTNTAWPKHGMDCDEWYVVVEGARAGHPGGQEQTAQEHPRA